MRWSGPTPNPQRRAVRRWRSGLIKTSRGKTQWDKILKRKRSTRSAWTNCYGSDDGAYWGPAELLFITKLKNPYRCARKTSDLLCYRGVRTPKPPKFAALRTSDSVNVCCARLVYTLLGWDIRICHKLGRPFPRMFVPTRPNKRGVH